MPIGTMRQTIFDDHTMTQFQSAVNDQFNQVAQVPIVQGRQISGVQLTTGTANTINHGLGRVPQGYKIVSQSANANIWNDAFTQTAITLHCSANCTVSVWVY